MPSSPPDQALQIDLEALSKRYVEEREKRLRSDAVSQYRPVAGAFAADPNALPDVTRAAVTRETNVLIIGGGFGGLLTAAQLRKRDIDDIVIVDKGADFGGTWYWNRYPGVRCDVDAYIYLPLLEDTGFVPSEKYATGAEIQEQCRLIAEKFGLYDAALFQTQVRTLNWDEKSQRWICGTDRGDRIAARFVVSSTGLFSSPKLPAIPGIEAFKGPSFHTSRWNYGFTGGADGGDLTGLKGKRVGVIGTGSTGIQCVPPVARSAEHLFLFQRTPCSVDIRANRPTDVEWFKSLPPGWQRERMLNFTSWTSGVTQVDDMVDDSMTDLFRPPETGPAGAIDPDTRRRAEMLKMEKVRQRIGATVRDATTAEALKPYYDYFCKRPGFSDDYLEVFNRANVTLVDTAGKGVERVTPHGLVVGGREYELDCIIYATGFEYMTRYTRESGLTIIGRDGKSLDQHWSRGARTLFGMQTDGFPNFFVLSVVQAGISLNYLHTADAQSSYAVDLIAHCLDDDIGTVEPTEDAVGDWVDMCVRLAEPRREFHARCTPSYLNFEGARPEESALNSPFAGGPLPYFEELETMSRERFAHRLTFEPRTVERS